MEDETLAVEGDGVASPGGDATEVAHGAASATIQLERQSGAEPGAIDPVTQTLNISGSERFVPGDLLGVGGMATVRAAEHVSLERTVAIKELFPDKRPERRVAALVREARITARLEHPNIVPVHELDHDAAGFPFIVMKRVVGESWRDVMLDEGKLRALGETRSLFEWNLSVLDSVCDAIRFAHSRGVIHRDLKPSNVMVGEYGEVYVVDWGIALQEDPRSNPRQFPPSPGWVGTPPYLAPEMLHEGVRLTRAVDVYQLGGVLYELLTTKPPHAVTGRARLEASILASPPELPPGVDPELVALVRKAMQPDPDRRHASVADFQRELREYGQHLASKRMLATVDPAVVRAAIESEDVTAVTRAYDDASGMLRHALDAWEGNLAARELLDSMTLEVARFEHERRPEIALELLRKLDTPPSELVLASERAVSRQEADLRRGRENDPNRGKRSRMMLLGGISLIALSVPLIEFARETRPTIFGLVVADVLSLVAIAVVGTRKDIIGNIQVHRGGAILIAFLCLTRLALSATSGVTGVDATQILCFSFLTLTVMASGLAVLTSLRVLVGALGYLAAFAFCAFHPELVRPATSFGHFTMLLGVLWHFRSLTAGTRAVKASPQNATPREG